MNPFSIPLNFFSNQLKWLSFCTSASPAGQGRCDIGPEILIGVLLPNAMVLAGIIFFILIMYYGFKVITSAGCDIGPQQLAKAQNAVTYSIIGLIVVVSAYFILQILAYITGIPFLNPPNI